MIRIHDSLTGTKRELKPLVPGKIGMYVCGMTVYDYLHIGHARMLIAFDVVARHLRYRGYQLTYVRNITDIDDKIIARAHRNGEPMEAVTGRFIAAMHEDCALLNVLPPDHEPRVTQFMPEIIRMVATLIDKGYAYATPSGDVMYAVAKFEGYGRLSGKRLADLRAGERVEVDAEKRDPLDFVLWKHTKPGEPSWESPWGAGRPGWHIECSAMSTALLGTHFDLHGGGMDLKFPHHENEIAQSCAATGDRFAESWLHNGFVNVDHVKMSKSLGNFFTVRDVLPKLRHPEVLRYFVLMSHYRGPINYSQVQLEQADAALSRLYTSLRELPEAQALDTPLARQFGEAMDDDFNTPEALAALQTLAREVNVARDERALGKAAGLAATLRQLAGVLGILQVPVEQWFRLAKPALPGEEGAEEGGIPQPQLAEADVEALIAARAAARKARSWAESDRIRDQLVAGGVIIEDRPDGRTVWRRA